MDEKSPIGYFIKYEWSNNHMKILGVTNHQRVFGFSRRILLSKGFDVDFVTSSVGQTIKDLPIVDVKKEADRIVSEYDLVFSFHCKQIFPESLTSGTRCINFHPGFNPYNRGWFPHIFSMVNGLPTGVTVHEMDKYIDKGRIIYQEKVSIEESDDSEKVYDKIMKLEEKIMMDKFEDIINKKYSTFVPEKGNCNTKVDYEKFRKIDLDQKLSFRECLNFLRALTHSDYKNGYFIDKEGNKIFIKILLEKTLNDSSI